VSGGCFSDERSDAQPPRRRIESATNKAAVLTDREELPDEIYEELFLPMRSP
jgi:hypothetical protein